MTGKQPVETPREWLRFADENLRVAEHELAHEAPAYHTVCFLAHGAAEKYLKGYLIAQGWVLQRTHDIVALLGVCTNYDPAFAELMETGAVLNEYIVAGRYPGDLSFESIGPDEAEEAVGVARQIEALVAARLAKGD
jgi:HEPN domain-containing protein